MKKTKPKVIDQSVYYILQFIKTIIKIVSRLITFTLLFNTIEC